MAFMGLPMKFSLIISTRGRVQELRRLFESLTAQTCQDFEIIVSDQNSDDRLDVILKDTAWKGRLTHLRNTGGSSLGRNEGLRVATGEIIGFPDDDCVYPKDILERVDRFFVEQANYGFLSGSSYDDLGKDSVSRAAKVASKVRKGTIQLQCVEFALFVRREQLGDVRFDEEMGVGTASQWQAEEGPDLLLRLMERGVTGYFDPALAVWHRRVISKYDANEIDRTYRYACGNGYFYRKHGYSGTFFAYQMLRSLTGLVLAVLQLNAGKARLYGAKLRGRWRGWKAYGNDGSKTEQ
jgi:glycosyltransferase involved in cell wall biosynthesis